MPTLPSKEELKTMMYRDLQKICKDWGVRANLKSDEMIDLLLEAQSKVTPAPATVLPPPNQQRSVSTRRSSRTGPSHTASLIVHDTLNETVQQHANPANASNTNPDVPIAATLARPVRTKKAKELQRRLGVGKPVAVGGTGARAVTRSSTISREKRLRSIHSMTQSEATIQEEPESSDASHPREVNTSLWSQNTIPTPQETDRLANEEKSVDANTTIPDYHKLLLDIVKPLQDQIDTLKAEVARLQRLEAGFDALSSVVTQIRHWEKNIASGKQPPLGHNLSTPTATSNLQLPPEPQTLISSPHIAASSPVLLGKRSRELSIRDSVVAEGNDEQEDSQSTSSPARKRPKLSEEASSNKGKEVPRDEFVGSEEPSTDGVTPAAMLRTTSFIVYNDRDGEDSPPPNTLLPDYYTSRSGDPSGSPKQGRPTSSANALENQNPFSFSFLPEPSTPGPSLFMPAFPYPEPPQSPTPAGASAVGSLGNTDERTGVFKSFGLPPPDRTRRYPGSSSDSTVNPAALSQRNPVKQRHPSSNEVGAGLGLIPSGSQESSTNPEREAPASGKTMYGTELGADNRFGDFGVEGVAAGFWGGGRF